MEILDLHAAQGALHPGFVHDTEHDLQTFGMLIIHLQIPHRPHRTEPDRGFGRERDEILIIRDFLPKPMDESEVDAAIRGAVEATGANSLKDMGAVMGHLRAEHLGRMDFGMAGKKVKAALAT